MNRKPYYVFSRLVVPTRAAVHGRSRRNASCRSVEPLICHSVVDVLSNPIDHRRKIDQEEDDGIGISGGAKKVLRTFT